MILDRTAISLPPVAWAAVVVLLVSPEELIGPSFQMSFGAIVALVAAYEATQTQRQRWRAEAGWGGRAAFSYVAGLVFTSLIATLATGPYSIYHFNRIAHYGVIANMIAVPLTGVWVMPWAVLAVILMPFGLERAWRLVPMGWGVDGIIAIAGYVAGLAERRVSRAGDAGRRTGDHHASAASGSASGSVAGGSPACRSSRRAGRRSCSRDRRTS